MDYSFIKTDLEFVKNPKIRFFFFVRNPHDSIVSFYKRMSRHEIAQPNFYKMMYELFLHIKEHAVHKPVIIKSEQFAQDPETTLRLLCTHLEIDYQENMLTMSDLSNNFDGSAWNEQKEGEIVTHWHGTAISSSAIKPARRYEIDTQGNPTFSEVEEKYREQYRSMYEQNKPYYDLLMKEKEYFL